MSERERREALAREVLAAGGDIIDALDVLHGVPTVSAWRGMVYETDDANMEAHDDIHDGAGR